MYITDLFPTLAKKPHRKIDLNHEAILYLQYLWVLDKQWGWIQNNPLITPTGCEDLIRHINQKYSIVYSHGGYREDRSTLWHETYLDELGFWTHLGVDINIPAWTELKSPISGRVILSDHDRDNPEAPQYHGWGNRIIIEPDEWEYALILAHLSPDTRREVGSIVAKWERLGTIGTANENGGWFEHFHIQSVHLHHLMELIKTNTLGTLDGYTRADDTRIDRLYPDPFTTF